MRRGQRKGELVNPIARWEPRIARWETDSEVLLMDTTALTIHLGVDGRTVRRYESVACDLATRAPLWDAIAVGDARARVPARTRRLLT